MRYIKTLSYLKTSQLLYRLYYRLVPNSLFNQKSPVTLPLANRQALAPFFKKNIYPFTSNQICFLNRSMPLSHIDWQDKSLGYLWLYNLHYFDALMSTEQAQRLQSVQLLNRWVVENPIGGGVGWEPYPISLRLVNAIQYQLSGGELPQSVIQSLYLQARCLTKRCEYHIRANHLFENFKALIFAGCFFKTAEASWWFRIGLRGLLQQLQEQVLPDGGHFEKSPMYHNRVLEGLLDIEILFSYFQLELPLTWRQTITKMLTWLLAMMRPNGEFSYFNDATNKMGRTTAEVVSISHKLGYQGICLPLGVSALGSSGYISYQNENIKLIMDVGSIGVDYQPGHAHADTLSFELAVQGTPVLTNLGTSGYAETERRSYERSTEAHNTVVVDGKNSSDVWSTFRVGKRARGSLIYCDGDKDKLFVSASHDGYSQTFRKCHHERSWRLEGRQLKITDRVVGRYMEAFAMYHFHPSCKVVQVALGVFEIKVGGKLIIYLKTDAQTSLLKTEYANSFGDLSPTCSIHARIPKGVNTIYTMISW